MFVSVVVVGCWILYKIYRKLLRPLFVGHQPPPPQTLDFIVAGFPKCGTTSILFALEEHPGVIIDDKEYCHIVRPMQQDDVNMNRLNRYLTDLQKKGATMGVRSSMTSTRQKLGIKCPEALKNFKTIHRLSQYSPHSKWIIGLRHPILFIQSFYNYRVLESHTRPATRHGATEIPTLHHLWETHGLVWRDLSRDSARYDLYLAQLGKTSLNATQLAMFLDKDMLAIMPNHFEIFLYTMDQIDDSDQSRKQKFEDSLLTFMDIDPRLSPIELGHKNKNHFTGSSGYPETINICATSFADIRASLLEQGKEASRWILDDFVHSPDVSVTNMDHFRESLNSWSEDPCQALG